MDEPNAGEWIERAVWDAEQVRCRACQGSLLPALNGLCSRCDSVHCPFCGTASHFWLEEAFAIHEDVCPHLLASYSYDQGEWPLWPFSGLELPRLPAGVRPADWPAKLRRTVFGRRASLLEAYETSVWYGPRALGGAPDEAVLFERLFDLLETPRRASHWHPRELGVCSSGGTDYFVADPGQATTQVRASLRALRKGLWRLDPSQGPSRGRTARQSA